MTVGVVDTTVIFHLFRRNPAALTWYRSLFESFSVTPITWMEVLYGAAGRSGQEKCTTILNQFAMEYLLPSDMDWAIQQMTRLRLSRGVGINDCLIASVCYRLNVPIYIDNQKDFLSLLPSSLVIKPY